MSADIIPFVTRDEYLRRSLEPTEGETSPLTVIELFDKLYQMSLEELDYLVKQYKSTGGWNPTAEKIMARMCEDVKTICASVAGERDNAKKT